MDRACWRAPRYHRRARGTSGQPRWPGDPARAIGAGRPGRFTRPARPSIFRAAARPFSGELILRRFQHILSFVALAAACTSPAPDAATTDAGVADTALAVPLAFVEGRLLSPVEIAGLGTHWFILDTAAGRSVISARLRRRLELPASDVRLSTVNGATGSSVMEFVRLPALRVAGDAHEGLWAVVADLPDFRTHEDRDVQGILGVDVLARYDVELDVPAGTLRLHPRDGSAASRLGARSAGVPFHSTVADGFVQFEATLHGDTVSAILDTGALAGTLNWHAAALAGVAPDSEGVRADARGAGGLNGTRIAAHRSVFEALCIGARCLPPTELRIMDLPVFHVLGSAERPALLLGADLLADCPLLLSYSTSRLHLCPEPAS